MGDARYSPGQSSAAEPNLADVIADRGRIVCEIDGPMRAHMQSRVARLGIFIGSEGPTL